MDTDEPPKKMTFHKSNEIPQVYKIEKISCRKQSSLEVPSAEFTIKRFDQTNKSPERPSPTNDSSILMYYKEQFYDKDDEENPQYQGKFSK